MSLDSKVTNVSYNLSMQSVRSLLKPVPWTLAEFRQNRIVQSPHENYFNVCRQHKEKCLVNMMTLQTRQSNVGSEKAIFLA